MYIQHRKFIFLDVDGVINVPPYTSFNPECLTNLYRIIDETSAKIIVSSSWRCGDLQKTKESLLESGFSPKYIDVIIGETCRGYHFVVKGSNLPIVRGNEIKQFVDVHFVYPWHGTPELDEQYRVYKADGSFKMMRSNVVGRNFNYVILDDDSDMLLEHLQHFIKTDSFIGLTSFDADTAIEALNRLRDEPKVQGSDTTESE